MNFSNIVKGFFVLLSVALCFSLFETKNKEEKQSDLIGQTCEMNLQPFDAVRTCNVPETPPDEYIAQTAVRMCLSDVDDDQLNKAYKNALILLEVERSMNIPELMIGMSLAAACKESKFNKNAEGDHRFSKDGKTPKAIGILQLWPIYKISYKVDRRDVASSAKGWIKNIEKQLTTVAKKCQTNSIKENWKIAWVTGVRAPKRSGRCKETVLHWKFFKKLRSEIENNPKDQEDLFTSWEKNES